MYAIPNDMIVPMYMDQNNPNDTILPTLLPLGTLQSRTHGPGGEERRILVPKMSFRFGYSWVGCKDGLC